MISNLEKLRELTEKLPVILTELTSNNTKGTAQYTNSEGETICFGMGLWKEKGVAVQRAFMPKAAIFPKHNHNEVEILIVYDGVLKVFYDDGSQKILSAGDMIRFEPNQDHIVEALVNTWLICSVIPAAEGYPDGK